MMEDIESKAVVTLPIKEYEDMKSQVIDNLNWEYEIKRRIESAELQEYEIDISVSNHEYDKSVWIQIHAVSKSDENRMLRDQIEILKEQKKESKKWYQFWK